MALNVFRLLLLVACALAGLVAALPVSAARRAYLVDYVVEFVPAEGVAKVSITLKSVSGQVRRLNFRMDPLRYTDVRGDGEIAREANRTIWLPPAAGGTLSYSFKIDHRRPDDAFDARITERYAIVRGDDVIPAARVLATRGTDSEARLRFKLPPGWTNVDTPYMRSKRTPKEFVVVNPKHRFDRPVGWWIAGKVGTRREFVVGVEVNVAAPKGEGFRRNDVMAMINWVLPEMHHAFGTLPPKILIVGAGDPMWRGGLSGPRSLFLHVDRPMIGEDGTSALVHELTHALTRIRGQKSSDWIAEGFAEYYSIALLQRTGTISDRRYKKIVAHLKERSRDVTSLLGRNSAGDRTARAVLLLMDLDRELRLATDDRKDIDNLTQALIDIGKVSNSELKRAAERLAGRKLATLDTPLLQAD